jgi:hypothetical protein
VDLCCFSAHLFVGQSSQPQKCACVCLFFARLCMLPTVTVVLGFISVVVFIYTCQQKWASAYLSCGVHPLLPVEVGVGLT